MQQNIEPVLLASAQIAVELYEKEEGSKYLVAFSRKAGSNLAFQKVYEDLQQEFVEEVGKKLEEME